MKRLLAIAAIVFFPNAVFSQGSYLDILAHMRGDSLGAEFGKKVVPAGDVNGDGRPDFLVGAYSDYWYPPLGAQKIYLFLGSQGGLDTLPDLTFFHKTWFEPLGDINGDGGSDYAMLESGQRYRISVYFGGNVLDTIPDGFVKGESLDVWDCFGCQKSSGKWSSSFYKQIVIGQTDPRYDTLRYYFYNAYENTVDSIPFFKWDRPLNNNGFQRMRFLGDINGDGFDDLIHSLPAGYNGQKGIAYIYFGGSILDTIPDVILHSPPYIGGLDADGFGSFVAELGDLNGDGIDDFSIGTSLGGYPFIYFGGTPFDTLPKFRLQFNAHNLANGGDINHDGYNDLIAGWVLGDITGYVFVYFGGPTMDSVRDLFIAELDLRYPSARFGQTVAGLGDVDGNGSNDFAVGSTSNTIPDRGFLYIFRGLLPPTDVDDENMRLPKSFVLEQNYPNPFNASTTIYYSLLNKTNVQLEIFNVTGQRVKILINQERPAGSHQVAWDGTDASGNPVSSGIYIYRYTANGHVEAKKMIFVK